MHEPAGRSAVTRAMEARMTGESPRPNFSGTWKWNPAKSVLQITGPDSTVFVIDHREPFLRISRTHVASGKRDSFTIDLTTDNTQVVLDREGTQLRARAYWKDTTLVFDTKIIREGEEASNTVRYSLDVAGVSFVAAERYRSRTLNYDNRWVLDKEDAAGA
jgi:hypothetical protein